MSTAEATGWLRELLEPHVGPERAVKLTVHGLKATLLSWGGQEYNFHGRRATCFGSSCTLLVSILYDLLKGQSNQVVPQTEPDVCQDQKWSV